MPPDASNELRSALQQQGDREVHPQLRDLSGQTLNMLSSYRGWPRQASDPGFGSGDGGGTAGSRLQGAVDLLGAYGGGSGAGERASSAAWEDREDGGGKIEHIAAGPTSSRADTSPDGGGVGPQGIRDPAPSSGDGGGCSTPLPPKAAAAADVDDENRAGTCKGETPRVRSTWPLSRVVELVRRCSMPCSRRPACVRSH